MCFSIHLSIDMCVVSSFFVKNKAAMTIPKQVFVGICFFFFGLR